MLDVADPPNETVLGLLSVDGEHIAIDVRYLAEVAHIETMQKLLTPRAGVLGTIFIRGTIVPVCDPLAAYSNPAAKVRPAIAAVVAHEDRALGLAIDRVQGLLRCSSNELQTIEGLDDKNILAGNLIRDGHVIHVIDASSLLKRDDVPTAAFSRRKRKTLMSDTSEPYLTFEVGGVNFAVKAKSVFGTVPKSDVQDSSLASGYYLGFISYLERKIPILDTNRIFGIGKQRAAEISETVVLQLPDKKLLGLAVDKICHVVHPDGNEISPLAEHLAAGMPLISSTARILKENHFIVDESSLLRNDDLLALARLSLSETTPKQEHVEKQQDADETVLRERDRYLMLTAGKALAVRMSDVVGMREPPESKDITPFDDGPAGLLGTFFVDGQVAPLVQLSDYLGTTMPSNMERSRVLIVEQDGRKMGFVVDSVENIATSAWVSQEATGDDETEDLVCLSYQGNQEVRSVFDILGSSKHVFAWWQQRSPNPVVAKDRGEANHSLNTLN